MPCCYTIKRPGMTIRVRPTLETWVEHLEEVSKIPPEERAAWSAKVRQEMQDHLARLEAEVQQRS